VRTLVCACFLVFCGNTGAHAGWFGYDNYEDCMQGRMKGQSPTMNSTVDKTCKKEFRVEFDLEVPNVKWEYVVDVSGKPVIWIKSASDGSDNYEITSGEFAFSEKSCESLTLTQADFSKPVLLRFIEGKGEVPLPYGTKRPGCAKSLSFRGKYK
jgi:hypothetical protein